MHNVPHGYTYPELIFAIVIVISVAAIIVAVANPFNRVAQLRDEERDTDVRNVMEVLVEMSFTEEENFAGIVGAASAGRTMLGNGMGCASDFGKNCREGVMADHCIDLTQFGSESYLNELPVDPNTEIFSEAYSGYYLEQKDGVLTVGACAPETRDKILLFNEL